jgi:phage shock protein C
MFCTQCGALMTDSARFCTHCGKPVGQAVPDGMADAGAPPKRLHRIIEAKKIAGVCAGFAEYFDIDVTVMRVVWVALLFLPPGIGLIAYIIAWAVLPKS